MTIQDIIRKKPYLIWYTKNYDSLDEGAIVEAVLNYGDWDDVQEMIKIMGIQRTAEIFRRKSKKSKIGRTNYGEKTRYYFNLYFNKYAPEYSNRRAN